MNRASHTTRRHRPEGSDDRDTSRSVRYIVSDNRFSWVATAECVLAKRCRAGWIYIDGTSDLQSDARARFCGCYCLCVAWSGRSGVVSRETSSLYEEFVSGGRHGGSNIYVCGCSMGIHRRERWRSSALTA